MNTSVAPSSQASPAGGASLLAAVSALMVWGALAAVGTWLVLHGLQAGVRASVDGSTGAPAPVISATQLAKALAAPQAPLPGKVQALVQQATPGIRVLGVVATASGAGAVLLQLGGEPPKPYAVGAEVPGYGIVQSVTPQAVALGDGDRVSHTLTPPARPVAAP